MVRAGDVTPTELVDLYLDRIDRLDPELNAFRDRARRPRPRGGEARSRSGSPRAKADRMPLAGVPIARQGHRGPRGRGDRLGHQRASTSPRAADGEMVRRLRAAGAIILGKTNLPELAICGFTETEDLGDHAQPVGHLDGRPAARAAARPPRPRPASAPAPPRRTAAGRSASRRRSAAFSESSRSATGSRSRPRASTGTACRSRAA